MNTPALILIGLLAATVGCHREEITHFRVDKSLAVPPAPIAEPAGPTGGLAWTLPQGWTQSGAGGMRYATLRPAAGKVEVSVVVLPGPAGGELANVNRWRGQLGLPGIDEIAAAAERKIIATRAGPFALYDFSGEGPRASRMIAALAVVDGNSWFLKMLGDAGAVGAARSGFIKLVEGLHVDATH